jgi:hypothetical protein
VGFKVLMAVTVKNSRSFTKEVDVKVLSVFRTF